MVNVAKETIEELMFAKGDSEEDIITWVKESETLLSEADQCIRQITKELKDMEAAAQEAITLKEREKKLEFEKLLMEQKIKQKQEAAKEKMEIDLEYEKRLKEFQQTESGSEKSQSSAFVKMPKLIISKFQGTPQDWIWFWGQFEAQINKSKV